MPSGNLRLPAEGKEILGTRQVGDVLIYQGVNAPPVWGAGGQVRGFPMVWEADADANEVNFNLLQLAQGLADGTYFVAIVGTDPSNETEIATAVFGTVQVAGGLLVTRPALTGTNSAGTREVTGSIGFDAQSVTCAWGLAENVAARAGRAFVLGQLPV